MSLCSCCVEHKCRTVDLIPSTCVVEPDRHREAGGLGISHSMTHRCSLEAAHVHRGRRARKKGRTKQRGGDGTKSRKKLARAERDRTTYKYRNKEEDAKSRADCKKEGMKRN